jgi:hypothetical protein
MTATIIVIYILCFIIGVSLGLLIETFITPKCKHNWLLINSVDLVRVLNGKERHTGYVKFYECEHCKKLKKEQIEVN